MFDIYVNEYKNSSGTIVSTEKLLLTVPLKDGYSPIVNPIVKSTEDMADSFDFSIESGSEYYDAFIPFKTRFRINYDGDNIFFGRVLTVNESTVFQSKSVHCEGALAYLKDSLYEGKQETELKEITCSDFLTKIIDNHNDKFTDDEPWKVITKGKIEFTPTDITKKNGDYVIGKDFKKKFEPTGWTETMALLNNLTSNYGGHFRIRCDKDNTKRYLDWYQYFSRDLGDGKRPSVSVKKNIIDISSSSDVNNIFTYVIPIGSSNGTGKPKYVKNYKYKDKDGDEHTHGSNAIAVTTIANLYTDDQLNDDFHNASDYKNARKNYGRIYITQSFPNADTRKKLWLCATDWIKKSYFGAVTSFNVKAVDFHVIDSSYPKILFGECVDVEYPIKEGGTVVTKKKKLVCSSVQYDLFSPEKTAYTFGIPSTLLNTQYGKAKKKKTDDPVTKQTAPSYHYEEPEPTYRFLNIYQMIAADEAKIGSPWAGRAAGDSFWNNGEYYGEINAYDYEVYEDSGAGDEKTKKREVKFAAKLVGCITTQKPTIWVCISKQGAFAINDSKNPHRVAIWYTKNNTSKYEYKEDTMTSNNVVQPDGVITYPSTGDKGDTQDLDKPTVKINPGETNKVNGKESSKGTVSVGLDSNSSEPEYKVKFNSKVTYTDEKGVERTADGFVEASDLKLRKVNSFQTQLIVTNDLVAKKINANEFYAATGEFNWLRTDKADIKDLVSDKANIKELTAKKSDILSLTAKKAYIEDLDSDTAKVSRLAAKRMITNSLKVSGTINATSIVYQPSGNDSDNLQNCFHSVSLNTNTKKLTFYTPSGSANKGCSLTVDLSPLFDND